MNKITDDELAGLSDEERAALAEDDESTEVDALDADTATDEQDAAAVAAATADDDAATADDDAADATAAAESDDDAAAAESEITPATEEFTPQYNAEPVEDYEGQITALAEEKKTLRVKYQDGDLTHDEYEDQREGVEDKVLQLREDNLKATMATEQNEQASVQRWQWEQDRFFSLEANSAYKTNPMVSAAFNSAVKALGVDEANEGKPMSWYLEEADRQVREQFVVPSADKGKVKDPGKKAAGRVPAKPDLSKVPPANLGDLPAAEVAETGDDGEFAYLDKLGGMELESALANMTPAQEARYLA